MATPHSTSGALSLPIERATTFAVESAEAHRARWQEQDPHFYQRFKHPTSEAAAAAVATLEAGEAGLVFSSGMGAIATTLIALLRRGDHVVAHEELFAQTRDVMATLLDGYGVSCTFLDARDREALRGALRPETRVVYLESPSNPRLHVHDVADVAGILHDRPIELLVDSTFASPILQQPLRHGATGVLHSGTKYLGGHSDVMCGVLVGRRSLVERVRAMQVLLGTVLDPQGAWLLHRGTLTLDLRVRRQSASALAIARMLRDQPGVRDVRYPLLEGTDEYVIAARQMSGGGGVVSFLLEGGAGAARAALRRLRIIRIATSLGAVETVIELPYDLDFDGDGPVAIDTDGLVRLSVGIEDPDLLMNDLRQAIDGARNELGS